MKVSSIREDSVKPVVTLLQAYGCSSVKPGNQDVLDQIDESINKGERVKLYYEEKFIKIFFLGDTKYFVYKVEPL